MKQLLGKAVSSAQSWGHDAKKQDAMNRKQTLSESNAALNVEQWAVNKAVHYNEWANFGRRDFEPVVKAFHDMLEIFRCPVCDSWLYVSPRQSPNMLRCSCSIISLNLTEKK